MVINKWLSAFRPKVARPCLEEARAAFPGVEFLVDDPGVRGVNPHELLAVGRVIATVQGIAELALKHDRLERQEIDFIWGANRDMMILETLNRALAFDGYDAIEGHLIGEQVLAADDHRRPVAPEGPHSPYGLVVNVYCHGQESSEVTPMWLAALGYEHLAWIGHRFDDLYGVVLSAHWLRVPPKGAGPGQIRWYADEVNAEYPPHPPCDLLHAMGATAGAQWHTVKTVSCHDIKGAGRALKVLYDIVMVSARQARESLLCAVRETRQMVVEMDVPDFSAPLAWIRNSCPTLFKPAAQWMVQAWFDSAADWAPKTHVTLQKNDFHAAVRFLSNKGRQQYSFRALQTEVDRFLGEAATHSDFIYLEQRAPEYFLHYRWNLTLAAFTYRAEDQAWQLRGVQAVYGPAFDQANRAVKGLDTPLPLATGSMPMRVMAVIAGHLFLTHAPYVGPRYKAGLIWAFGALGRAVGAMLGTATGTTTMSVRNTVAGVLDRLNNWANRTDAGVNALVTDDERARIDRIVKGSFDSANRIATEVGREMGQQSPKVIEQILGSVVCAPIIEEGIKQLAKRAFGEKGLLLACAYCAFSDIVANPGPGVLIRLPVMFGLHYWFAKGGYVAGMVKHALWNVGVLSVVALGNRPALLSPPPAPLASGQWGLATAGALAVALAACTLSRKRPAPTRLPVEEFDTRWYTPPGAEPNRMERLEIDDSRSISPIPPANRYVPPFSAVGLSVPAKDPTVTVVSVPTPFSAPMDNVGNGYFRIWGHNAPMFRPSGSMQNMRAVIDHRLAIAISHQADVECWWMITALFAGQFTDKPFATWPLASLAALAAWEDPNADWPAVPRYQPGPAHMGHLDRPEMVAAWLEHTDPAKRERYVDALAVVAHAQLSLASKKVRNVQVNVKKDEVLLKYRMTEADNGSIPRPIHNVDPMLAVSVGPDVYAASMVIKRAWHWRNVPAQRFLQTNGRHISLTYGAGLLADDLNEWFAHTLVTPGWHILVAGDDSVVIKNSEGRLLIIEGDISKCDHSVRLAALMFEYRLLVAGGMDPHVCWFLLANSSATCVAGSRMPDGGSVRIYRLAERNTGGVDTTVGNTVVTGGIHALACAICRDGTDEQAADHFKATFALAGLALKARVWSGPIGDLGTTYYSPSFLKGYWYPTVGEPHWQWGPLPSRMLKISKIMTDPRRVYHLPKEAPLSYEAAAARHVASLYMGLSPYVWPSELLTWLHSRSDPAWTVPIAVEEWSGPWRPIAPNLPAPVTAQWKAQAAWWYGCDEEEVEGWLAQLLELRLLEFGCHPFWVRMALKDYN